MDKNITEKAHKWLNSNIDGESKKEIKKMLTEDQENLTESFYKDLEFGTGGMRGIMGIGSNRMNIYTVGMATQGLANYVNKQNIDKGAKAAIAYDCRNNSSLFAQTAAEILSANGIEVYLFDALRPTPELSFAIRHLNCQCGIVVTASHNPKEYNGYKVYWEDGGQVTSPHDKNIISEVKEIATPDKINYDTKKELINIIGNDIDDAYIKKITDLSLSPEQIADNRDMPVIFTPIHGTGVELIPRALKAFGFDNIINIEEQDKVDGNFPTVKSPNPEDPAAFDMALEKAKKNRAEIIMGTDPDGDRVGVIVRKNNGDYQLLNGNQTASVLYYYILKRWKELGKLKGNEFTVKTIVTSEILAEIADNFGVESYDTLTGFKYIAAKIKELEDFKQFVVGGEESYGYLAGDFIRDKDAVIACALIAEAAAWAKSQGKTLWDILIEIYLEYGFFKEKLISVKKEGQKGEEEIRKIMENLRYNSPDSINGQQVTMVNDFYKQKAVDKISDLRYDINLPESNVLQFLLSDGTKISIRPSGTEPKIKFYVSVRDKLENKEEYENKEKLLDSKIDAVLDELI